MSLSLLASRQQTNRFAYLLYRTHLCCPFHLNRKSLLKALSGNGSNGVFYTWHLEDGTDDRGSLQEQ